MSTNLFEKLQIKNQKNILIQGLPSTLEKQFYKLSFAKNITPLLKVKRIDLALIFAVNEKQLNGILEEVLPALHDDGKVWIAYPKKTSKIASDLNRDCNWENIREEGFEVSEQVVIDHVWNALQFKKVESIA